MGQDTAFAQGGVHSRLVVELSRLTHLGVDGGDQGRGGLDRLVFLIRDVDSVVHS